MEIDQSFIAAVLTVVGYSINDKVVIFDRIREIRNMYPKRNITETINEALRSNFFNNPTIEKLLAHYEVELSQNKVSSFVAAHHLLDEYFNHQK